ncbi:cell envelope-related function transcriptional attenuator common domain protein [Mycobacterium xenopi 4042]|uniref:Cell envelope-related function transcriptional attenuator common domain protein n=1 Tax=Mycobacterium xenopi 4042 TaxID=1299334 RepID=X8CMY9_MYCXE|nr:cell envelope-related function transcriptional attenuator common domain protein [Mycobacterium xenopi 4042]
MGRIAALTLLIGCCWPPPVCWAGRCGSTPHCGAPRCSPTIPAGGAGPRYHLAARRFRQPPGLTVEQQQALSTGGDTGNGRTDTILLVHVPGIGSSSPTTMVSIPRDSYVPIPGYGGDKINAAFAMGGAPLLAQTVEQATGLRLDHYVEIGFSGFARLVDALGGSPSVPPQRSTIRSPVSICRPDASAPTAAPRSAMSAAGQRRAPTWTGWCTSASCCRRCCTVPPAQRSGSIPGGGIRCRARRPTR